VNAVSPIICPDFDPECQQSQAPWADPGGPYSAQPGQAIQFNSSGSGDDGFISAYSWNFGDGTISTLAAPSKAYAAAGTYSVSLRVRDNSGLWSAFAYTTATISNPAPVNNATFVSQSVPTTMNAGQQYNVSVTMYNSGTKTWTATDQHRLGAQNPQDNKTWGFSRVNLPATSVAPGQSATFNFTVTAPSTPGTYNFQWRMLQEWIEWFGAYAPNVAVTVAQPVVGSCSGPAPCDGHPTISYDPSNNRINTAGWLYDAAGNQIRALSANGVWQRYVYDAAGRLVRVKDDAGNTTLIYRYGASNQRLVTQEGGDASNVRTYHVWDANSVVAEFGETSSSPSTPAWRKNYIYMASRLLATQEPTTGGETVFFHHPDHLGTRLVSNLAGGSVAEQTHLPFGNPMSSESAGAPTNRRFTSYERSAISGLDYAINRHYDPLQGRFTQADPIGVKAWRLSDPQTLNLYAYCANDPVNHVDPDGLFFGKLFKGIGKVIKGVGKLVGKVAKGVGKVLTAVGSVVSKVLHNRWVMLGVALASLFFPPVLAIYKSLSEWASILQVTGLLLQQKWDELKHALVKAVVQWVAQKAADWALSKILGMGTGKLSACARAVLQANFPSIDLSKVRLHYNVPSLGKDVDGFTWGNDMYLVRGQYDPLRPNSNLALIGHELEHTRQFFQLGGPRFGAAYIAQWVRNGFRYDQNIPFEAEAYGKWGRTAEEMGGLNSTLQGLCEMPIF
jgi:RHS repeat-associated protein